MTPDQFIEWRKGLELQQNQAAEVLDLNRRTMHNYEMGNQVIPKTVSLACAAIALGITHYPD